MKSGVNAALLLTEDGRKALRAMKVDFPEAATIAAYVEDTDELGLWIQVARNDGPHIVLIRWGYILSIDMVPVHPVAPGMLG